ncbi:MAG: ribonuclease activity regulator RraA [Alphaproteobacteria bacterium]|nr:ribonuclease activity regulator RraA [Alphaproteobacteria bacterium]
MTGDILALDDETRALLLEASTATLSIQLLKRGFRFASVGGVAPLNRTAARFAGPAYTLRFIPAREDLATPASVAQKDNPQRLAIEDIPVGAVLVIDARGERRAGTLGDILAARLLQRGVAGVVSDGAMRDAPELEKMALPIFCAGIAPPPSFNFLYPVDIGRPIGCGGAAVFPGDIVVGDGGGVVVIPRHLVLEVARDSVEQERLESFIRRRIDRGHPTIGNYPATEETRAAYRRWIDAGRPDEV